MLIQFTFRLIECALLSLLTLDFLNLPETKLPLYHVYGELSQGSQLHTVAYTAARDRTEPGRNQLLNSAHASPQLLMAVHT